MIQICAREGVFTFVIHKSSYHVATADTMYVAMKQSYCDIVYSYLCTYRTIQNFGGRKFWQIW